jgi:hypothetical protein
MARTTDSYEEIASAALRGLALLEQPREAAASRLWLDVTSGRDKLRGVIAELDRSIARLVKASGE